MGNLKRFLAMTLTMLMVVGLFTAAGSVAAFDDVVDYQQQINLMSVLKIIEGYSEDEFGPDNDVERWHMALWIAKIMTGKVDDAYVNWYSTQNNTAFADLDVDHFYGSISYCNENGVVIGTSATTFEPANGIMIQDVFTMVVRMLGYGSSQMDSNYPWSYVDKAIQLGLDKDLASDYNNEDVATREQAAVILYNALFALKADGTTYAESKFNLTIDTVVLTGTSKANMFASGDVEGKKLAGENYVAFNQLNADGTLGSETFYLLKSWFGFDEDNDENLYFGQSYKVITKDNYTTLVYCEAIEGYWLDQTDFDGKNDSNNDIIIEGKNYKAVKAFTYLNSNQGSKTTDELELLVYRVNSRATENLATSYVMDSNRNILKADGKTVQFYFREELPYVTNSWKDKYVKQITLNGATVEVRPSQADWDSAYTYATQTRNGALQLVGSDTGFRSHNLYHVNAYSDTVLYDDNFDGIFDRAMYTGYKFGFISYNDNNHFTMDGAKTFGDVAYTDGSITYVTADGEKLAAADVMKALDSSLAKGNYVLYTINKDTRYVTIKEFFTPNVGLVTSLDKPNSTITFDQVYYNVTAGNVAGSKFNVGNARLPGATFNEVVTNIPNGDLDQLQGRTVHYIEKDGHVLAIYEAYKNVGKYLVFDSVVGINSTGYVNALVYNNSNTRSVITVASVDGGWYGSSAYAYSSNARSLESAFGELFTYTVDALGNYHLTWLNPETDYTYYYNARIRTHRGDSSVEIEFTNGIAVPSINGNKINGILEYRFFENAKGVSTAFAQFNTNADSVIVVLNRSGNTLHAFKGIPETGAEIDIYKSNLDTDDSWSAKIFVDQTATNVEDPSMLKFMYIRSARFDRFTTRQSWDIYSNDTIVYIDDDCAATEVYTNQTTTGYGVTLGAVYTYNMAVDFVRGGVINNILTYNLRAVKGNFYGIKDGYLDELIPLTDSRIGVGYLQYIDTYESVFTYGDDHATKRNYTTNYLYQLSGTNIVNKNGNDDKNPKNMVFSMKSTINTDNAYAPVYYYNGNLPTTANVFIYESVIKGTTSNNLYKRQDMVGTYPEIVERIRRDWNIQLESYYFNVITSGYTMVNWYEITLADYNSISEMGTRSNDAYNSVVNFVGTNMQLLKGNKLVENFTSDNVLAFTKIMYANNGGYKYFLGFTVDPDVDSLRVGDGDNGTYTLRYTASGTITPKELTLTGFGLEAARFALLSYGTDSGQYDLRDAIGNRTITINGEEHYNRPKVFANVLATDYADIDWTTAWAQYASVRPNRFISRFADQIIVMWGGKGYIRVPKALTYDSGKFEYSIKAYNYEPYYDGTGTPACWTIVEEALALTQIPAVHDEYFDVYEFTMPVEENIWIDVEYKFVPNETVYNITNVNTTSTETYYADYTEALCDVGNNFIVSGITVTPASAIADTVIKVTANGVANNGDPDDGTLTVIGFYLNEVYYPMNGIAGDTVSTTFKMPAANIDFSTVDWILE